MKKTIALTLVFALGFQFLSKLGLITYYQVNKEFVIEEYCENKSEPQLLCEGSCFLKKSLEKNAANDKERAETVKPIEVPIFLVSSYSQEEPVFTWLIGLLPTHYSSYYFLLKDKLFHPPQYGIA